MRIRVSFALAALWMTSGAACDAAFHFDAPPSTDAGVDAAPSSVTDAAPEARRPCTADATCPGLRCDLTTGVCVQCLEHADCSGSLARCDPDHHLCVACLTRHDCGERRDCDATTHRCLDACFDADDVCPSAGFVCDGALGLCIECKTSANCSTPTGAVCDVRIGRCVECTGNAQCPVARPVCDLRSGRCQECVASPSCAAGRVCDPSTLTCVAD
ncbi:MAG: hypothetical protein JWP97_3653 [Labilithrix sp.]|nr:hypothetical protein [Labilithrix sp.]